MRKIGLKLFGVGAMLIASTTFAQRADLAEGRLLVLQGKSESQYYRLGKPGKILFACEVSGDKEIYMMAYGSKNFKNNYSQFMTPGKRGPFRWHSSDLEEEGDINFKLLSGNVGFVKCKEIVEK